MNEIDAHISSFQPITLAEMDAVSLLNRTDTKYVISLETLASLLDRARPFYRSLAVEGKKISGYDTQYFDTPELKFYHEHHRGRKNRVKVRIRQYVESNLFFLEIKRKNNKGRTIKSRKIVPGFANENLDFVNDYFEEIMGYRENLEPILHNTFWRITLVDKAMTERVTIDLAFGAQRAEQSINYKNLVIVEVKQEGHGRGAKMMQLLKDLGARPQSISKYCLGVMEMIANVKRGAFKMNLRFYNKIEHGNTV